jgi:peptidoglycan/xylan/chitin deacetylase (PgdA/CDA1 family)
VTLRSGLGAVRRKVLCSLSRRTVPLGNRGPIVSFSFDDFPRTACSNGAAILERFEARGTFYAAFGLMNTSSELGELFHSEDVDALLENGHELASHTFSHVSCRSTPLATFLSEVAKGRAAIEAATDHAAGNFAYPFGDVTLQAKRTLGSVLTTSRGTIPGFNGPEIDLNLLRANRLYGDSEKCPFIERLILQNVKQKSWLIFYTHDVRPGPSEYGCTPALLEFAVSLAARSGSRILTIRKALDEIGVIGAGQSTPSGKRSR